MPSDRDLVSSEDHEINYLLRKWDKKQSKKNREILVGKLKDFKHDDSYAPHNRDSFYKYVDDKKVKDLLEDFDPKKGSPSTIVEDIVESEMTIFKTAPSEKRDTSKKTEKKSKLPLVMIFVALIIILLLILLGLYTCKRSAGSDSKDLDQEKKETVIQDDNNKTEDIAEDNSAELLAALFAGNTPIFFKANKTTLLEGEKVKIDTIVQALKKHKKGKLIIDGHTAKIGKSDNEKKLSIQRAQYIKKLIQAGLNEDQDIEIITNGYGSTRPAIRNPSKSEKQKNRRIEIAIEGF